MRVCGLFSTGIQLALQMAMQQEQQESALPRAQNVQQFSKKRGCVFRLMVRFLQCDRIRSIKMHGLIHFIYCFFLAVSY